VINNIVHTLHAARNTGKNQFHPQVMNVKALVQDDMLRCK
jgi:hypothetical protein